MINALTSMVDFVLQEYEANKLRSDTSYFNSILNYANFLKQPLELWMFVPVDKGGNVMEEPDVSCLKNQSCSCGEEQVLDCREWKRDYNEAKSRCLFEGFYSNKLSSTEWIKNQSGYSVVYKHGVSGWIWGDKKTLEDITKEKLPLSPAAINQIYKR